MSENPTTFESIPNEILIDIFEYLSSCDIFQGFYFLNKRYNTLLQSFYLRIDLINIFKSAFDYYNYFIFCFFPHRIISLRCEDVFDRLMYQIRLSKFTSLKYLTILNLSIQNLLFIIPQLDKLKQLVYLNLQTRAATTSDNVIIFQSDLPSLQKCILNLNNHIIFRSNRFYQNLQYLTIHQCTINNLLSFLYSYTRQLQQLTITLIDELILNKVEFTHHLKSLRINTQTIPFHRLTNSLFHVFPNLHELSINATGIDYSNGKQWATILSSNFPDLLAFHLRITFPHDDAPTADARTQLLQTFQTSYYRSHKWYFTFMHRPSSTSIEFFSIPLNDKEFSYNLYDTYIEPSTMCDKNMFIHIKELSLIVKTPNDTSVLPNILFSNVRKLKLISEFQDHETFPRMLFVDISHLIKLPRLYSIEFIGQYFPSTSLIFLDYTPHLQSLIIPLNNFIKMTKILNDEIICQRLTTLIKHLTITSIDNIKSLLIFERLSTIFPHLNSLSLFISNVYDLYIIIILILPKMSPVLKTMRIFIETICNNDILKEFMLWLIDYIHTRELNLLDVKLTDYQLDFSF